MIGIVLITHGKLALEFFSTLEHVAGPQENIKCVCIASADNMEHKRQEIQQTIQSVNLGKGVIVLTDMFGGVPSNLAISIMEQEPIEVIAGINLPMLVKLTRIRQSGSLIEAATAAQEEGRKYINIASQILNNRKATLPLAK